MNRHRNLRTLAMFGLAGMATSYLVASFLLMSKWGSVWYKGQDYVGLVAHNRMPELQAFVTVSSARGFTRISASVIPDHASDGAVVTNGLVEDFLPFEVRQAVIPWGKDRAWPDLDHPLDGEGAECEYFTGVTIAGWPFQCAWSTYEPSDSWPGNDELHIPIPKWIESAVNADPFVGWRIAYKPIWFGLAMDTVFYGAAWWGLAHLPRWLQRKLRHRRNQCERCAYSRLGLGRNAPCPECGLSAT